MKDKQKVIIEYGLLGSVLQIGDTIIYGDELIYEGDQEDATLGKCKKLVNKKTGEVELFTDKMDEIVLKKIEDKVWKYDK